MITFEISVKECLPFVFNKTKYVDAPEVELSTAVVLKRLLDDAASYASDRRKGRNIGL